jgi:hypothetical protein
MTGLADEAFEPHRVDRVGCHRQPVAVGLPLDQAFRQRLPQPGSQPLQGIRRVGGRPLTPDPVDKRRLRDYVTWFEREGDQQRAQPGARHVGEDAVVRANLERTKHPDLHLADFATSDRAAGLVEAALTWDPERFRADGLTRPAAFADQVLTQQLDGLGLAGQVGDAWLAGQLQLGKRLKQAA